MPPVHLRSAVEALLFSSDQPLPLSLLAEALDAPTERVSEALQELGADYKARESGVELREMAGGWIVTTTAEQHEWVARMLRGKRKMRLSRAALETLAIIAYKQPVTKSEIEAIRGVDSSGTLATLLERSLVTIKGRSTVVGRPLLYGSTGDFLNYFGLKDLTELPRPEELRALVAAREPEQLEMLELDADGMPLALVAGTPAGEDGAMQVAATHVAGDTLEASDTNGDEDDPNEKNGDDEFDDDEADDDEDDDEDADEDDDADDDEDDDAEDDEDEDEDDDDDDDADEDAGEDESERPSASFAKRPSR
jgi:segregation and condensation protein B